ncbi:hypothetical protein DYBT9275_02741 [Dyadobacter sp. CECT 9275]|uniref:DUF4494 domain-containing protein n=1 Tax=Dyadobacter helix TaxID=2822344 RepID=A0A916JCB3_9BACT|nr:DUF4494 domain-containing protein [Dyadobacter sp. CECT 9275]CAG5001787.1 hypothetical protein DYBT9275_02741 [Dyadobacter sp. CECT 9275]
MASWYNAKIRYQKEDEAGSLKTINESYLIDSVSFTEAEARAYKQIVTGASDFGVISITRMRLADLFIYEEGEKWYKIKVVYFSVDERSGKEKKVVNYMLLNAESVQQAQDRIIEELRNFLIPYEIESVSLTPILEVFPYQAPDEQEVPDNFRPVSDAQP